MRQSLARTFGIVLLLGLCAAPAAIPGLAAPLQVVDDQTPWRVYLVTGEAIVREQGQLKVRARDRRAATAFDPAQANPAGLRTSPMPSADWIKTDFDDHCWPRYQGDLADFLGGWGVEVPSPDRALWPARICLRTCFGISDPTKANDLKLTIVGLGGVVVYVNGQEIGRGHMPQGEIAPLTPAEDYPIEAYTTDDGKTPLPVPRVAKHGETSEPEPQWVPRYGKRIRTITISVPSRALVKGRNVLAIALHRAALAGPLQGNGWSHVGFRRVDLTSASGSGVIPYAQAIQGTHVWSASTVDQVAETLAPESLIHRSWFWTLCWGRGMPVKGVQQGNPFDLLLPVRITMPRNGVGSGQMVLSDAHGLRGVTAAIEPLKGPTGLILPASAVQIRFAVQHPGVHYCDALMEKAAEGAKTVPVWLVVQAPKDQPPGWYVSTLNLEANGKRFSIPVQVLVTGLTLPDAKYFSSTVGLTHSPETVARHYGVELWSEAHWKLLEKTLALMGQMGNDVVHVPILVSDVGGIGKSGVHFNWQPILRWAKTPQGLKPDFTILNKYLDTYVKHCAPPQAISLYIWGASSAKEHADAYENRRIPTRENVKYSPPMVTVFDPETGTISESPAPAIGDEGSEKFWKPMLNGVRALVLKRSWSERTIMLALGGDVRPGQKTAELVKQWAPYARWDFLSHFSGDPPPKDGRMIATGGMEVGMMEWPCWTGSLRLPQFEERVKKPYDFLELPTDRWMHQPYSPPLVFRTMTANWGCIGRVGLDFWQARTSRTAPRSTSFFSHVESLMVPGPDGPLPTVRFQMLREGIQDAEVKTAIVRAYLKLPEEERRPYQALLEELLTRMNWGSPFYLSQSELCYDWPGYVARLHQAAAELAGVKGEAAWNALAARTLTPRSVAMSRTVMRTTRWLPCIGMAGVLVTCSAPVFAIINPRFTPADLIRSSAEIILLKVSASQQKQAEAEVVETLQGEALKDKKLKLDFTDAEELSADDIADALGGAKTADAVLLLAKRQRKGSDTPVGVLQIGTQWFAVSRKEDRWCLDKDKRDMFAIWAGSARMLAKAVRCMRADPTTRFPVRCEMTWGEALKLGRLAGPANGCLVADLGKPTGLCAIVLCEAGDRAYRAAPKEGKPSDVTAQVKLRTASKAAAVGDFDGDGRMDLISWDGRSLELAVQTADGTFAALKDCGQLAECLSLDCIDVGGPRPRLVAGTSHGPVLLVWDAGGALKTQPLAIAPDKEMLAKLGGGGLCIVADFNGDGRSDVMTLFARGALLYAGEGPAKFKAPQPIALPLVDQPRAAICGDFDADGLLDVIVAGKDGLALLSRESPDRWSNATYLTGELAYHGNANRPQITACAPCDVNTDGRQAVAMFYTDRKPLLFFNRGFSCFGWARELDLAPSVAVTEPGVGPLEDPLSEPKPAGGAGPEDLKEGQATGAILDLNGDGIPDMLAVGAKEREVWAVLGRRKEGQSQKTCVLALPPSVCGPVTVTVRDENRTSGMYVVRPGIPALVGRSEAGPMTLDWIGPDGKAVSREVVLIDEGSRFEIKPGIGSPTGSADK